MLIKWEVCVKVNPQYISSILAKIALLINPYKIFYMIQMDMVVTF
jgi:hypothetical protein